MPGILVDPLEALIEELSDGGRDGRGEMIHDALRDWVDAQEGTWPRVQVRCYPIFSRYGKFPYLWEEDLAERSRIS